jgi:AcrR family transcriptional regulator
VSEVTSPGGVQVAEWGADRRQRKKQRTRDALIRAGMRLFEAKGYLETPIHEITDAVDVSERTFFRHFTSKEDLVLSLLKDSAERFAQALAGRPPDEDPFTAARGAFHAVLRALAEDAGEQTPSSYLSVIRLIESTPVLLAAHLRFTHEQDTDVIRVLAEREGVDYRTDPRPRVLAATIGTLAFLANRDWQASEDHSLATMAAAFDRYAGQLIPALAGHWRLAGRLPAGAVELAPVVAVPDHRLQVLLPDDPVGHRVLDDRPGDAARHVGRAQRPVAEVGGQRQAAGHHRDRLGGGQGAAG